MKDLALEECKASDPQHDDDAAARVKKKQAVVPDSCDPVRSICVG